MNTTEIIAPDGTLLLTDRIPKSAVYVVLQDGWLCEGYDAGRWGVMSTHRTRALAEAASRRMTRKHPKHVHPVVPIPGRLCTSCRGSGVVKRNGRWFDCGVCGGHRATQSGTSGYEQAEPS